VADETLNTIETKIDTAIEAAKGDSGPVAKKAVEAAKAPVAKAKKVIKARRTRKASAKVVEAVKQVNKRAAKTVAATATKNIEGMNTMQNDFTKLFGELPGADKFQSLFGDAGERTQELAEKGQKAAADMVEIAKANAEALAESGRIATAGVRDLGRDLVEASRGNLDKASESFKTLSAATSPAEFLKLQSEMVRGAFDQFVAEGSKLTERMVKLAGESMPPIQNRASRNADAVNELMA